MTENQTPANPQTCSRMRHRSDSSNRSGLTAIEVLISLVLLSMVTVFSLHALEFTRRIALETEQFDQAVQISRDILQELKAGQPWQEIKKRWESTLIVKAGAEFNVQILEIPSDLEGTTDLEVTLSWVGPKGLEQQVFNTTVFNRAGEQP
jgi:hypothetical protein